MSLFSRKKRSRSEARQRFYDPEFPCSEICGVTGLSIDYDPAIWMRIPGPAEQRPSWAEEVGRAFAIDVGVPAGSPVGMKINKISERIMRAELDAAASFVAFMPDSEYDYALAYIDIADDDALLRKWSTPENLLANGLHRKAQKFPQGWQYNIWQERRDDGGIDILTRGYKYIDVTPAVHLIGTCNKNTAKFAEEMSIFARTKVHTDDGRCL